MMRHTKIVLAITVIVGLSSLGSKTRNIAVLDSLTPGGDAGFIEAIERHQSLSMKIPCGPYDSSEVTFRIQGLERALISAGMKK